MDEIYTEDCVFYDPNKGVYRGRDELDRIAGAIRATHRTFNTSQSRSPRKWAMAGGSNTCRATLEGRQLTLALISSLSGTAGSQPFISFSTNYAELSSIFTYVSGLRSKAKTNCRFGGRSPNRLAD
jgi:hypothetical protein